MSLLCLKEKEKSLGPFSHPRIDTPCFFLPNYGIAGQIEGHLFLVTIHTMAGIDNEPSELLNVISIAIGETKISIISTI